MATEPKDAAAPAPVPAAMVAPQPVAESAVEVPTTKKALIIVGNHKFDRNDKRMVIVVEAAVYDKEGHATPKLDGYPGGANMYYRVTPDVVFPESEGAEYITLGIDIEQFLFWGFSPDPRYLSVGPASPAFGAANIAAQRGATEIEIVGLTENEKDRLAPYLADLPTNAIAPSDATIILT